MKQLISLFLLGVTVFLTGCNASQVGGITQATEKVFTETDNQVESEKVLKQSHFF